MRIVRSINAGRQAPVKVKETTAKKGAAVQKRYEGFTEAEKAAMKDRVDEMKPGAADGEAVVLAKVAEMSEPDRTMARRIHAVITANAPNLTPRLWYGMPAYTKDGKIVCHYQPAEKFKTRYPMLGFSDQANLDDGDVWPVWYAVNKLTAAAEKRIGEIVREAVG
jgi:uncharacterized protein YdhG (YjbR/CyaY superfamily)